MICQRGDHLDAFIGCLFFLILTHTPSCGNVVGYGGIRACRAAPPQWNGNLLQKRKFSVHISAISHSQSTCHPNFVVYQTLLLKTIFRPLDFTSYFYYILWFFVTLYALVTFRFFVIKHRSCLRSLKHILWSDEHDIKLPHRIEHLEIWIEWI